MRQVRPLIALSLAGLMALSACGEDVAAKDLSLIHISEPTRPY